ncbi:hypothetical protein LJC56_11780, partial [Christensenellaceae bacterium OttesenSCG-928-K19]|nr:hypothetical protein [Christensenellaceae bacterium OttesenSCG-928-K19]
TISATLATINDSLFPARQLHLAIDFVNLSLSERTFFCYTYKQSEDTIMPQAKMTKYTYRLISFFYITAIILLVLSCINLIEEIVLYFAAAHLSINYSPLSLVAPILSLLLFVFIIWDKGSGRAKRIVALSFVETMYLLIFNIFNFYFNNSTFNNQTTLDLISNIAVFCRLGIFLVLSLLLFGKLAKKQAKEIKLFPLLVATLAITILGVVLSFVKTAGQTDTFEPLSMVFGSVLAFVLLFTKFLYLYSSLSNRYVYRYFLQNHPRKLFNTTKNVAHAIELF